MRCKPSAVPPLYTVEIFFYTTGICWEGEDFDNPLARRPAFLSVLFPRSKGNLCHRAMVKFLNVFLAYIQELFLFWGRFDKLENVVKNMGTVQ